MDEQTPHNPANRLESDPAVAAKDRNLSREAAKWRTQYRAAESRIAELESQLAAHVPPTGAASEADLGAAAQSLPAASGDADPEVAELIAHRDRLARRALALELRDAGALEPELTAELLEARGALVLDDDAVFGLVIDGAPVPIDRTALTRILPPTLLRPWGAQGTGSRTPRVAVGENYDMSVPENRARFLKDASYRARARKSRR